MGGMVVTVYRYDLRLGVGECKGVYKAGFFTTTARVRSANTICCYSCLLLG